MLSFHIFRTLLVLTLCISSAPATWSADYDRHPQIDLALKAGFVNVPNTPTRSLLRTSDEPKSWGAQQVVVFFEGDGAQWTGFGTVPPRDPTPRQSVALDLALSTARKSQLHVMYVARPCQFDTRAVPPTCNEIQWTEKRYSKEQLKLLLSSTETALKLISPDMANTPPLALVGHSGGGLMSIRAAAAFIRKGYRIHQVTTLASPIDPIRWSHNHRFSPLDLDSYYEDLDLVRASGLTKHYLGENDKLVTIDDVNIHNEFEAVPGVGHATGWLAYWQKTLLKRLIARNINE